MECGKGVGDGNGMCAIEGFPVVVSLAHSNDVMGDGLGVGGFVDEVEILS